MKMNMFTVAAMVLATGASAQCTLPATLPYGTVAGSTLACVADAALAAGDTCNIQLIAGYTGSGGTTVYSVGCTGSVLTDPGMALTGCAANYYQTAGNAADNIECTACAIGKLNAATASLTSTAKCAACVGATAGNCVTGCPADHFQIAAATVSEIKCTACANQTTIVATAYRTAATTCVAALAGNSTDTSNDASDGQQVQPLGMGLLLTAVGAMTYWK